MDAAPSTADMKLWWGELAIWASRHTMPGKIWRERGEGVGFVSSTVKQHGFITNININDIKMNWDHNILSFFFERHILA